MFVNAVTLILQEILEASLLISVLQVLTTSLRSLQPLRNPLHNNWIYSALGWGISGAVLYGWLMPVTAMWFDYAGYEVINALLQAGMIFCLLVICTTLSVRNPDALRQKLARSCLIIVVTFGIMREGSEIILYLQGIMSQPENITPAMLGALMATGIGGSSGLLLYYMMCSFPYLAALRAALALLALFAGNMAAQAVMLLTQADWLPYTDELWNTADVLSEDSIMGRLLYALVGYDANPTFLQVTAYTMATLLVVQCPLFKQVWFNPPRQDLYVL